MVLTHIYKLYIFISTLYTEFFLKFKSYMKASLATTAGRRTQLLITWRLGAVCGCADGVGHVDSAVAGDAGDKVRPEAARAAGLPLEAVAGGLPVRRGAGGGVEAPDAAAAGRRGGALPAHGIPDAGGQHANHLPARHGAHCRRGHQEQRHQDGGHRGLLGTGASHGFDPRIS
jgi:hypothetical protein